MESSYEWQIKLIRDWQYFATLTWNPRDLGTMWKRRNQVTYWLRKVAQMGETTEKILTYIIRWESGETGGLPHCHILISGMMRTTNPLMIAFKMNDAWIRGVSQVRLFDPGKALGNAAYMTKGKFSAYWAQGANAYEVRKFGQVSDDSIYVSRRAQERMLEQRVGANDRAHSTQAA
jgi:hypothetical protein